MKIHILHESDHYVLIEAPMCPDGSAPVRETLLPLLESLRTEHGLRYVDMSWALHKSPAMICEKLANEDR